MRVSSSKQQLSVVILAHANETQADESREGDLKEGLRC